MTVNSQPDEDESPEFPIEHWVFDLSLQIQAIDHIFDANRDEPRQQYGAYLGSLAVVTAALSDLPEFRAQFLALQDLARRLEAMSSGQKALLPIGKSGRPNFSLFDWELVGRSAAVVTLLVQRNVDHNVACENVAKALHKHGVKGRRGHITKDTVSGWLEGVSDGSKPKATPAYNHYLDMFLAMIPKDIGRNALDNRIGVLVRPFGFRQTTPMKKNK